MRKTHFALSTILPLTALTLVVCFVGQPALAQNASGPKRNPATQQQTVQSDDHGASSVSTFSGTIVKSENKFVLEASDNLTTYRLDDQQKAHDFLNKRVKITGSLDASTGMIHVSAINPA